MLAVLGLAACGGGSSTGALLTGSWGGTNVALQATSTGATLQFKCSAQGTILQPVQLDAQGRFDATGTYAASLVPNGPQPAEFQGTISGTQMTLSVTVQGSTTGLGPYQLAKDAPPHFDVCNF